jgi:transcriptional regulator
MNATSVRLNQTSIVQHILLDGAHSTLRTAVDALELQSILFTRVGVLVADGDAVSDIVRIGYRAADDAVIDCREHAASDDIIGVVDCLARVTSGHRIAKNLLSTVVEIGDADVAELALVGIQLADSVLDDLGT